MANNKATQKGDSASTSKVTSIHTNNALAVWIKTFHFNEKRFIIQQCIVGVDAGDFAG